MTASKRIRASIEALPEYARADVVIRTQPARWSRDDAGNVFASQYRGPAHGFVAEAESNTIAEHIALLASPHVGEKVAALLEAIQRHKDRMHAEGFTICHDPIHLAADALTAAIEGEQR